MFGEYRWSLEMDEATAEIFELTPSAIPQWVNTGRNAGLSDGRRYLCLALAAARYTDHHGPYIGHGTFGGDPLLRASAYLPPELSTLALAQTAAYVAGVIHHPNYGPYRLMDAAALGASDLHDAEELFIPDLESGEFILLSENRGASLLRQKGRDFFPRLMWAALRQYPENEHRLLIVHRAAQLLDDVQGWAFAEPLLRPAIQYLASRPRTELAARWQALPPVPEETADPGDPEVILREAQHLCNVGVGEEPEIILGWLRSDFPTGWLSDILAVAGSEMLLVSGFDAHAVTGLHCALDILHDPTAPAAARSLAAVLALSSSRTVRQKNGRRQWREFALPGPAHTLPLERMEEALENDSTGMLAEIQAAQYLQNGGSAVALSTLLVSKALRSSGPFEALHNVKMIHGLLLETRRSHTPGLAWRHLAAGAGVVARSVEAPTGETAELLAAWQRYPDFSGPRD